jgi:hypothetical protein
MCSSWWTTDRDLIRCDTLACIEGWQYTDEPGTHRQPRRNARRATQVRMQRQAHVQAQHAIARLWARGVGAHRWRLQQRARKRGPCRCVSLRSLPRPPPRDPPHQPPRISHIVSSHAGNQSVHRHSPHLHLLRHPHETRPHHLRAAGGSAGDGSALEPTVIPRLHNLVSPHRQSDDSFPHRPSVAPTTRSSTTSIAAATMHSSTRLQSASNTTRDKPSSTLHNTTTNNSAMPCGTWASSSSWWRASRLTRP